MADVPGFRRQDRIRPAAGNLSDGRLIQANGDWPRHVAPEVQMTARAAKRGGQAAQAVLNGLREFGFLDGSFDDGLGHLAAFAALGGNTQLATDVGISTGVAAGKGFANLTIGYGFAETDVHTAFRSGLQVTRILSVMRITVNKQ